MRTTKTITTIIVLAFLLAGCLGAETFYRTEYENMQEAYKGLAVIETKAVLVDETGTEVNREQKGIAILLEDGLVLALSHVTDIPLLNMTRTHFGYVQTMFAEKLSETYAVNGEEVQLIGRKGDISLFRGNHTEILPYPFGDSSKLEVGDRVAVIGFSFTKVFNFKDGVISFPFIEKDDFDVIGLEMIKEDLIMFSVPINPGDSGSPLIAFRNGKCEVVGIVNAMLQGNGMGLAIPINYVAETIVEILTDELLANMDSLDKAIQSTFPND